MRGNMPVNALVCLYVFIPLIACVVQLELHVSSCVFVCFFIPSVACVVQRELQHHTCVLNHTREKQQPSAGHGRRQIFHRRDDMM